jgi:ferritin-like metal-binding protein YciE
MLLTTADMRGWIGAPAMDPYGTPLGAVAAVLADRHSGAPEWLLLADPGAREGRLVPVAGAVPSGRQVRVVPTAESVNGAPASAVGEDLDADTKASAAAHYGMALDRAGSPTGILSDPHARPEPARAPSEFRWGPHSEQVVQRLRAAHAMEQASLKLLAAMRWRTHDEELVHDIALHHKATNDHAERIRVRLDELEANRARPLDWLGKMTAYLEAQRGRLRKPPEPADLKEACRFEQAEAEAYRSLRELAERAGDEATAELCEQNLADELAMVQTLLGFRLRADPGFRRERESPFQTPAELAEIAPES